MDNQLRKRSGGGKQGGGNTGDGEKIYYMWKMQKDWPYEAHLLNVAANNFELVKYGKQLFLLNQFKISQFSYQVSFHENNYNYKNN